MSKKNKHKPNKVQSVADEIAAIIHDIRVIEADLDSKRRRRDFHGVRDACVDIETAEAKLQTLRTWFE